MKPLYHRSSRRHFLMGAGGAALAIPLLPSLLPREVSAQSVADASSQRFFVHMTTWHAAYQDQFFGSLLNLSPSRTQTYGGFAVRAATLPYAVADNQVQLSEALRASAALLTPRLAGLTNVINGLDFSRSLGHNRGGTLGCYGATPTIDQVLAASRSFYPNTVTQPVIVRNPVSFSWANAALRNGVVPSTESADSNVLLFDRLFSGSAPAAATPVLAVDQVREHAQSVLNDPRCSIECRQRLTQYLDMLAEVQSKLNAPTMPGTTTLPRPTTDTRAVEAAPGFIGTPSEHVRSEKLWNDLVVAAFAAGVSRIYVSGPSAYTFGPEPEHAWHNNVAHALADPAKRAQYSAALQRQFEGVFLDLAQKMDAVRGADGGTLLDKALLANSHELGSGGDPGHHHNRCIPLVTLGNAGGYFATGLSLDYRDLNSFSFSIGQPVRWYGGLLYNQWLGMALRSMGVSPAEYAAGQSAHYGYPSVREGSEHSDAVWATAGQDLPWLKA